MQSDEYRRRRRPGLSPPALRTQRSRDSGVPHRLAAYFSVGSNWSIVGDCSSSDSSYRGGKCGDNHALPPAGGRSGRLRLARAGERQPVGLLPHPGCRRVLAANQVSTLGHLVLEFFASPRRRLVTRWPTREPDAAGTGRRQMARGNLGRRACGRARHVDRTGTAGLAWFDYHAPCQGDGQK
jgi:hypothetical protein